MDSLYDILEKKVEVALTSAFSGSLNEHEVEVVPCQQESFGHFQCNSAMKLAKSLKKNPREIAQIIIDKIDLSEVISKLDIAGPGFINITLTPTYLSKYLENMMTDPLLGAVRASEKKRVIVEFSSPNIAKELHVGHLRSTIIGESLARLFEFLGYDVLRLNHIGDWGTQFGMLIAYMKERVPEIFSGEVEAELPELMEWYKASKKCFDSDPEFKKRSQLEVVKLQSHADDSTHAWNKICDISRKAFSEIYELLDVEITERGESFYNSLLTPMIEDLQKRKIVQDSNGATCIFPVGFTNREGNPMPLMVQKSDGGFSYDSTDLAALKHRVDVEKADRIIIVTDMGQSFHFQLVFKAAEQAGYYDPQKVQLDHVSFGLVLGSDGKKFKTRSGDTEKLIDLLQEAINHAKKLILERTPDIDLDDASALAKSLGIAAVKYADLSTQRQKDYTFSYDRMLRFDGNTALFLLYSYVRIMGIKRKTEADLTDVLKNSHIDLEHPSEVSLGLHLIRFGEVLGSVSRDLMPHKLCDYLYELAEKFNAFFRDCKVIGSEKEGSRLVLCEACAQILKQGLHILGIQTVDRM